MSYACRLNLKCSAGFYFARYGGKYLLENRSKLTNDVEYFGNGQSRGLSINNDLQYIITW